MAFQANAFQANAFQVPAAPSTPASASAPLATAQLGDLALVWDGGSGSADLVVRNGDLAADQGLDTAILLSLFLDRRAEPDDVPPSGDPNDRRGSWMDQFAAVEGDKYGSRLWLLDREKLTSETPRRAEEYVREALAWMIEDRVVASIDVAMITDPTLRAAFTAATGIGLAAADLLIGVTLQRPGRDPVSFRFAHVWDNT